MRILVVGAGGREHALVWQLARRHRRVYCVPGNGGIANLATCIDLDLSRIPDVADFAQREDIDLTIVGPEGPLAAGIADEFERRGLPLFGPGAAGARLESDKAFAKRLMFAQGIPTAEFEVFTDERRAHDYLAGRRFPLVVKASGLAAGKGVVVCQTLSEARQVASQMLSGSRFGAAGQTIVIEEYLEGEEASIIGFSDGRTFKFLPPSQDHKRLLDGDQGPNTGGMGAYAPALAVSREVQNQIEDRVFTPLQAGLAAMGLDYRGVVYAGMMLTTRGPVVLEFNCRFGDPETQAVMPLLETDLAGLCLACIEGRLGGIQLAWSARSALCVVLVAQGYPESYRRGDEVTIDQEKLRDVVLFHSGTKLDGGRLLTNGGRVLGVTGLGSDLGEAHDRAYEAVAHVHFLGKAYRRDIGVRGLKDRRV